MVFSANTADILRIISQSSLHIDTYFFCLNSMIFNEDEMGILCIILPCDEFKKRWYFCFDLHLPGNVPMLFCEGIM
ncbi:MAG: hypothetical protein EA394_10555 [Bacteroidia bacterium]|nr:MAG: hypothetical protein EA394_10555 [Bacteroidia bacterium]